MIDFNNAIEIAKAHFLTKGEQHLTKIYESENSWIVYAGNPSQIRFGNMGISINKETGEITNFILPSRKNFETLKNAKLTELL